MGARHAASPRRFLGGYSPLLPLAPPRRYLLGENARGETPFKFVYYNG